MIALPASVLRGKPRQRGRRPLRLVSLALAAIALIVPSMAASASPAGAAQPHEARFVLPSMPGGGFGVDIGTMLDRKFYSVVRQRYDFSCGSAALATLLRYHYGVPADENMTFNGMWEKGDQEAIRKSGFSLLDMKRYLAARGLATEGFKVTLDQIAQARAPGIALTVTKGYRHFVVVKGVTDRDVLVGDPSRGMVRYSRAQFNKIWDGLYFVITSARAVGQDSFNRPAQWNSVSHSPIDGMQGRAQDMEATRIAVPQPLMGDY
jgi:hypothetical protein